MAQNNKIAILLTEEEWIEVIKLVDREAGSEWNEDEQNEFNGIKTRMLFQLNQPFK